MADKRRGLGDFQTPSVLCHAVLARMKQVVSEAPQVVIEPTCGRGNFLVAAAAELGSARLLGFDIQGTYVEEARQRLPESATIEQADFFGIGWREVINGVKGPVWIIGNPPWVTNAEQGRRGVSNLPKKSNLKGLKGLDAITGGSNFDISEWMLIDLSRKLIHRRVLVGLLVKTSVARSFFRFAAVNSLPVIFDGLWRIDAMQYFGAAVDAGLLVFRLGWGMPESVECPVFTGLSHEEPDGHLGVVDGHLVADAHKYKRLLWLSGEDEYEWRSGLKHDCSKVMELRAKGDTILNGLGDVVDVEPEFVFPLLKSSDLARGRQAGAGKYVIVPQRAVGESTECLRVDAPRLWEYLNRHGALLDDRKSRIYRGRPRFSIFGIGSYSFRPYKVAISGLYKSMTFRLVAPIDGKPAMLDDTCYFLGFDTVDEAQQVLRALQSQEVQAFMEAQIFWDAKRPITKSLLQRVSVAAALRRLSGEPDLSMHNECDGARQQAFGW